MGMACEAEGRAVSADRVVPLAGGASANAQDGTALGCGVKAEGSVLPAGVELSSAPMNTEETAMILTSLSKGQFGDSSANEKSNGNTKASARTTPFSSRAGDSDGEDMDEFSDEEDDRLGYSSHVSGSGNKVHRVQQINFDGPKGSKLDFTDDAGFSHRFRNESNRVKSLVTKHISIDELRAHFDRPIIDVAKDFGICITLMKKICRRNGIKRWPHRQIRSLSKSIASMEAAMLSAHGSEREKYRDQIVNLKLKRESVIADPNKDSNMRPKATSPLASSNSTHSSTMSSSQQAQALRLSPRGATSSFSTAPTVKMESLAVGSTASTSTHAPGSGNAHSKGGRWTSEEHAAFLEGIRLYGKDWRRVAQVVMTRSAVQTRTHAQKYLLKFAGRFPFDADGGLKDQQQQQQQVQQLQPAAPTAFASSGMRVARQRPDMSMLSPVTSITTPSDDSASTASWNSEEPAPAQALVQPSVQAQAGVKPPRTEAMAMILNSSPQLEPEAEPRVDAGSMGMTTSTLPPLASRTGFKMENASAGNYQQSTIAPPPPAFRYLQPQQPQPAP